MVIFLEEDSFIHSQNSNLSTIPMRYNELETMSLALMLSRIGGFWKFISSLVILTLSAFIFDRMLLSEAKCIQFKQDEGINDSLEAIVQRMKSRLSFVKLYGLFDDMKNAKENS